MNAVAQQLDRYGVMQTAGSGDDGTVNLAVELVSFGECRGVELAGNRVSRRRGGIDDGDELHIRALLEESRVDCAEMSHADDCQANGAHAAILRWSRPRPLRPPCWCWRKLSKCETSGTSIPPARSSSRAASMPTLARKTSRWASASARIVSGEKSCRFRATR